PECRRREQEAGSGRSRNRALKSQGAYLGEKWDCNAVECLIQRTGHARPDSWHVQPLGQDHEPTGTLAHAREVIQTDVWLQSTRAEGSRAVPEEESRNSSALHTHWHVYTA